MLGKIEVAGIGLNLNPQVRFSLGQIDAMRKSFDRENLSTQHFDSFYVFSRYHNIQIQADQRLSVGVNCLAADNTVPYPVLIEQRD